MIEHRHFAYLKVSEDDFDLGSRRFTGLENSGTDSDKLSLAERERFLERAGELMDHLGRGDFQGRDGGLKALSRLSRRDGAPWEAYLSWADFDWWGHHHGSFHPYRALGFKIWEAPVPFQPDEAGLRDGRPHAASRPLALDGRPGREILLGYHYNDAANWMFLWEKEPTLGRNYFWQFSLHIGDWDRAPQWLGLWRLILETVRFPHPLPWG